MNSVQAWLMIPQLVERYGAKGARAMIDLLSIPGQDPVPGYIVRADAYLMEKQHKEAAQLYLQAAQASLSTTLPGKAIGLYEAAIACDPDDISMCMELITFLGKVKWFWRVSDHLHECALLVHSEKPIGQWLAPLQSLYLDLCIQKSLLRYLLAIKNLFPLKTDRAKVVQIVQVMREGSSDTERVAWNELVTAESPAKEGVAESFQ